MRNFDYDDINLVPKKGILNSRSETDTKVKFGPMTFELPVVPANMSSVINEKIAIELAENKYFYIMHRFNIDTIKFVQKFQEMKLFTSISVGVTKYWYDIITELKNKELSPDYITIDIAHGHSVIMVEMIKHIKKELPNSFVIAGNVATKEGAYFLKMNGADAVKIGVAPGSVCETAMNTGFGSRGMQASVIKRICSDDVHFSKINIPMIADGNIKYPGDINKSLVLGATMCMAGSMFSNLLDSPNTNNIIEKDDKYYVEYWGSASVKENKTDRIEGKVILKEIINRTYMEQMRFIKDGIESGISYAGGKDLNSFKKVKFEILG